MLQVRKSNFYINIKLAVEMYGTFSKPYVLVLINILCLLLSADLYIF